MLIYANKREDGKADIFFFSLTVQILNQYLFYAIRKIKEILIFNVLKGEGKNEIWVQVNPPYALKSTTSDSKFQTLLFSEPSDFFFFLFAYSDRTSL